MYIEKFEKELSDEFQENGYIIKKTQDINSLNWIKEKITEFSIKTLERKKFNINDDFLNNFHNYLEPKMLNEFRLKIITKINDEVLLKQNYYRSSQKYLDSIVGNELVMQNKINLSIQFPKDESSLLPLHSDTWSGDSPFEVVVWIPLVNCFRSKSMYILPPKDAYNLQKSFIKSSDGNAENLFDSIKDKVKFIDINFGQILIFNQNLPHGNIVNEENETRWSMNCRFKSVFSPYGDKKLGEFFQPISLKIASKIGMEYKFPDIK